MTTFILGQIIGGIAVLLSLSVYQIDDRRRMLKLSTISAMLFAVSFFLISAYTGTALNLIGGIRCYAFIGSNSKQSSIKTFLLFGLISIVATCVTWAGPISVLALLGTLFSGLASGQLSTRNIRRIALIAPPLWFLYNFVTRSYPGMFVEIFIICSNFIGQYRFDKKRFIRRGQPHFRCDNMDGER